jgi:lipoate-protein ligase A
MKLLDREGVSDPARSAAVEEFCVRHLSDEAELLLLYVNAPAVVIGRHQVAPAEADLSFLARENIRIVRRLSGGGAVYHDPGNLNFALVSAHRRDRFLRYDRFLAPVVESLREMGIPARFQAPNAIAVKNKKVSGNAQFTDLRRMITHGTLLFSADLDAMEKALSPRGAIVESRGVASVPSPVTNLNRFLEKPSDTADFRRRLLSELENRLGAFEPLRLSEGQQDLIDRLHRRYRSWQWTWGRAPRFAVDQPLRGPDGNVSVRLTVEGGIVRKVLRLDGLRRPPPDAEILFRPYDEVIGFAQRGKACQEKIIES